MAKDKLSSTQEHLPIAAVEEGMIIMRDSSYRAVLKVGSVNFNLKTESEQNALIGSYQSFLNSLEFPIQIVMQSRHLDLEPYLKKLEARVLEQKNELIRQQTEDYVAYVRELINVANIMDKQFFVVVPYTPIVVSKSFFSTLFKSTKPTQLNIDRKQFGIHKEELMQRASVISNGLSSIGLKCDILETDDLVRMLYSTYNSDIATEERVDKTENLASGVVTTKEKDEQDQLDAQVSALESVSPVTQSDADLAPTVEEPR